MSKTLCAAIRTLLAVFLFVTVTNAQSDSLAIQNEKLYTLLRKDLKAFAQEISKRSPSELARSRSIVG
ncbi:MAG TPA: hypothetical protein VF074_19080, partial [Pyrinomonadaceae bacterium]